jgi:hypothetical protein
MVQYNYYLVLYDGAGPNINDFNQGGFDSGVGFDINPSTRI